MQDSDTTDEQLASGSPTYRRQIVVLVATVAVAAAVLVAFGVAAEVTDRSFGYFSRDATDILDSPRYIGMLSRFTVLVWAGGAIASFFTGWILASTGRRPRSWFHIAFGSLGGMLALDDFFLLHEAVYPKVGIPEELVFVFYGLCALALPLRFRSQIEDLGGSILLLSTLGLLGVSAAADVAFTGRYLLEDGPKTIGVALWTVTSLWVSRAELLRAVGPGGEDTPGR